MATVAGRARGRLLAASVWARWRERVTGVVLIGLGVRLGNGDTRIQTIARQLAMSARTLQRRLAEEGVSYQELLDAARRETATRYLTESTLAIGEIAYLLGYSEPAAFHRAFRRWHETTPEAFRLASIRSRVET